MASCSLYTCEDWGGASSQVDFYTCNPTAQQRRATDLQMSTLHKLEVALSEGFPLSSFILERVTCPGWPRTSDAPASTYQVLGLQACTATLDFLRVRHLELKRCSGVKSTGCSSRGPRLNSWQLSATDYNSSSRASGTLVHAGKIPRHIKKNLLKIYLFSFWGECVLATACVWGEQGNMEVGSFLLCGLWGLTDLLRLRTRLLYFLCPVVSLGP